MIPVANGGGKPDPLIIDEPISSQTFVGLALVPAEDGTGTVCTEHYVGTDTSEPSTNEETVMIPHAGEYTLGPDCLREFWRSYRAGFVNCPLCMKNFEVVSLDDEEYTDNRDNEHDREDFDDDPGLTLDSAATLILMLVVWDRLGEYR